MAQRLLQVYLILILIIPARAYSTDVRLATCTEAAFDQALAQVTNNAAIHIECSGTIPINISKSIRKNLTIDTARNIVTLDGQHRSAILRIESGATVTLKGLVFINGRAQSGGDAINNRGVLTLIDCLFRSHQHAIVNFNQLVIVNSQFNNNTGNAIYNAAKLQVTKSVFTNNGRGIDNGSGQATILNSIFRGNKARPNEIGAGIANSGILEISESYFLGNTAEQGGAIGNHRAGQVRLNNSVLINNQQNNCFGEITSGANNVQWPDQTCSGTRQ